VFPKRQSIKIKSVRKHVVTTWRFTWWVRWSTEPSVSVKISAILTHTRMQKGIPTSVTKFRSFQVNFPYFYITEMYSFLKVELFYQAYLYHLKFYLDWIEIVSLVSLQFILFSFNLGLTMGLIDSYLFAPQYNWISIQSMILHINECCFEIVHKSAKVFN